MQISTTSFQDNSFPDTLRQLTDSPKCLNVLGTLPKDNLLSIVGTRRPTAYGAQITYQMASELAKPGVGSARGLASGVGRTPHRAAFDAGGRTVAPPGHGLARIHPPRHKHRAKEILATGGAPASEYDLGVPPMKHHF